MWFWKYLSSRGYCSCIKPTINFRSFNNRIIYQYNINTYTFTSLNWMYDIFYLNDIKILPSLDILQLYLTPLTLAIQYQNNGEILGDGASITFNSFNKFELESFNSQLQNQFHLKSNININSNYIYIYKESMPKLTKIIKPHMISSMYYKLNGY